MLEPARIFLEGRREDHLTVPYDFVGKPIVHLFRRQQRDATVAMLLVIPGEEILGYTRGRNPGKRNGYPGWSRTVPGTAGST